VNCNNTVTAAANRTHESDQCLFVCLNRTAAYYLQVKWSVYCVCLSIVFQNKFCNQTGVKTSGVSDLQKRGH